MKGSMVPTNVEAKLRELAKVVSSAPIIWPDWFKDEGGSPASHAAWSSFLTSAADELEQRSLYAGRLLRRLAGD